MTFDLQSYLEYKRASINAALDAALPPAGEPPEKLHEAMRYSVMAPGKRLRPTLVIAAAEAVGGLAANVMPAACALECIHVFSLIHDDLPCMDNDDFRRGLPTSHKVYGEALALLAGDALLTLAFQLVAENAHSVGPERLLAVILLMAEATGTRGMVGGQVVDMESQGVSVSLGRLQYMHSRKTGALMTASVEAGALLAGASAGELSLLRAYGSHIGLAFQIADDILDITGNEALIGKHVGSDQERDKATYPRLLGLDASRQAARVEVDAALDCLRTFGACAEPLRAVARYIVERDA